MSIVVIRLIKSTAAGSLTVSNLPENASSGIKLELKKLKSLRKWLSLLIFLLLMIEESYPKK